MQYMYSSQHSIGSIFSGLWLMEGHEGHGAHDTHAIYIYIYIYILLVLEGKSLKNRRNAKKRSSCMVYGECEGGDGQNISNRERCVEKNRTNSS